MKAALTALALAAAALAAAGGATANCHHDLQGALSGALSDPGHAMEDVAKCVGPIPLPPPPSPNHPITVHAGPLGFLVERVDAVQVPAVPVPGLPGLACTGCSVGDARGYTQGYLCGATHVACVHVDTGA